jgi:hypothetical protein
MEWFGVARSGEFFGKLPKSTAWQPVLPRAEVAL